MKALINKMFYAWKTWYIQRKISQSKTEKARLYRRVKMLDYAMSKWKERTKELKVNRLNNDKAFYFADYKTKEHTLTRWKRFVGKLEVKLSVTVE
jgi:hypothetical protein